MLEDTPLRMHIDQLVTYVPPAPLPFTAEDRAMLDILLNTDEEEAEIDKRDKENAEKDGEKVTKPFILQYRLSLIPYSSRKPRPKTLVQKTTTRRIRRSIRLRVEREKRRSGQFVEQLN